MTRTKDSKQEENDRDYCCTNEKNSSKQRRKKVQSTKNQSAERFLRYARRLQ